MKRNAFRITYLVVALLCALVCLTSCKANPENTSSGTEASAVNDISQVENTVSEAKDTSSVEETISKPEEVVSEPAQVQDNSTTASQTTTKRQTKSQTSKTQSGNSGGGVTINPVNPPTVWNGDPYSRDPNWKCPDQNAHPGCSIYDCINHFAHDRLIESVREKQEADAIAAQQLAQKAAAHGMTVDEYNNYMRNRCPYCERPYGDGHNGTCHGYYQNGTPICVNYD